MPVVGTWRLNERHYGALQGIREGEANTTYGDEQVRRWKEWWRASDHECPCDEIDSCPPAVDVRHPMHPGTNPVFEGVVPKSALPCTESSSQLSLRVLPCWVDEIAPCVLAGLRVLVVAHEGSLRALCGHIEGTMGGRLNASLAAAIPLVVELDDKLMVVGARRVQTLGAVVLPGSDTPTCHDIEACRKKIDRRGSQRSVLRANVETAVNALPLLKHLDLGQTGGVYLVRRSDSMETAVFKPQDEEGFDRRGIRRGCGAVREESAYMIDRMTGSAARVPVTARIRVPARKISVSCDCQETSAGSVQIFVPEVAGSSDDFGMPRRLNAACQVVSLVDAQQIASLDIRLCNTDRHGGNLLFQKSTVSGEGVGRFVPIPIDNGCALPKWWAMGEANFSAWEVWPQVHEQCEPEVLATLKAAFAQRQEAVDMLAALGLETAARTTYEISVTLLHEGVVRHGLSLGAVAMLMCRDHGDMSKPSWLEEQMASCASAAGLAWEWTLDSYGDQVPVEPADIADSRLKVFVDGLTSVFRSEAILSGARIRHEGETARV
eukprot:TRINITY_DN40753_c0_g1_i1.p1 TRINITY_DN40753_c0_g1~~TRINITY_DN40753_c0_g1_i1.p1  ORF type:complete len:644 (+),score=91.98 TRINITY_DN40753_c0_g1_i1:287-1933(+)